MRKLHTTRKWLSVRSDILNVKSKLLLPRAAFHRRSADFVYAEQPVCSKSSQVSSSHGDEEDPSSAEQRESGMWTPVDTVIRRIRGASFSSGKLEVLRACWLRVQRELVEEMGCSLSFGLQIS